MLAMVMLVMLMMLVVLMMMLVLVPVQQIDDRIGLRVSFSSDPMSPHPHPLRQWAEVLAANGTTAAELSSRCVHGAWWRRAGVAPRRG